MAIDFSSTARSNATKADTATTSCVVTPYADAKEIWVLATVDGDWKGHADDDDVPLTANTWTLVWSVGDLPTSGPVTITLDSSGNVYARQV